MAISLSGATQSASAAMQDAEYNPEAATQQSGRPAAEGGNPVDRLWWNHVGNLAMQGPDPDIGGFRAALPVRERMQREEVSRVAVEAKRTGQSVASINRKLAARDVVTVGGLFFGGPAVKGGAGLAGAVAGAAGRIALAGGIGAGIGAAEGVLGGYTPQETGAMATGYGAGGLAVAGGLEALGGIVGAGMGLARVGGKYKALNKLMNEVDLEPRSVDDHALGVASTGELAAGEALDAQHTALRGQALELVRNSGKFVRGHLRSISKTDFKNPSVLAWGVQRLRDAGHEIPDGMAGDLVYEALKDLEMPLLLKAYKGSPANRLLGGRVAKEARTVFDMVVGMPDVGTHYYERGNVATALRAAREHARGVAARKLEEAMHVGYAINADTGLAVTGDKAGDVFQSMGAAARVGLVRVGNVLRDESIFGKAGPAFADAIHRHVQLADAIVGHNKRIVDSITKPLNFRELMELDDVLRWGGETKNPKVSKAAEQWVNLRQMFADDTGRLDIHTKDRGLTTRYTGLKGPQRTLVDNALEAHGDAARVGDLREYLDGMDDKTRAVYLRMKDLDAEVERKYGVVSVIRPFKESALNAPDYYDPKMLEQVRKDDNHPVYTFLRERYLDENPELVNRLTGVPDDEPAVRAAVHEMLGAASSDAPEDIRRNSLQWSREAILPAEWRISDPRIWMNKYAQQAGTRQSVAKVFGGRNEKFHAIQRLLVDETHQSVSHGAKFAPRGGETKAEELFQTVFDIMQGGGPRTPKPVKVANSAVTVMRLGFRTGFKQLQAISNSAVAHGVANTADAMIQVLLDPRARALPDDIGATVQDIAHVLEGDMAGQLAEKHVRYTGIVLGDRLSRRTSAFAAGLKAHSAGRALLGIGSKNLAARLEGEQALRWFQRLSVDTDAIIRNGGKVEGEALRQVMRAGARNTQFASTVEDLSYLNKHPLGKLLLFLNKFNMQYGTFLKEEVIKEASKANMKPLIGLAIGAGVSDQTVGKLLEFASKKDYDATGEIIQDAFFGKIGQLAGDIWEDPQKSVFKLVTGPAVGLATDVVQGGVDLLHGKYPATWEPATLRQIKNMWANAHR